MLTASPFSCMIAVRTSVPFRCTSALALGFPKVYVIPESVEREIALYSYLPEEVSLLEEIYTSMTGHHSASASGLQPCHHPAIVLLLTICLPLSQKPLILSVRYLQRSFSFFVFC